MTVMACYAQDRTEAVSAHRPRNWPINFAPWVASKAPGRPVFDENGRRTAEMLRVDLKAAGIKYETAWESPTSTRSSRLRDASGGIGDIGQDLSDPGPAFDAEL